MDITKSSSTSSTTANMRATAVSDYCHQCEKRVYITERMGPIKNSYYHKLCFKCSDCGRKLDLKTYSTNPVDSNDTHIYCQSHVPRMSSGASSINDMHIRNSMKPKQDEEKISSVHHFTGLAPV